ncbi:MAG: hypothetical protein IJU31_06470 [Synergistaceae bacterium]|nr:hypothetical protein [Synergistaceae bacterium]
MANGQMGIYAGQRDLILAFDPGRDKTGFAVVDFDGGLIFSGLFQSEDREKFFDALIAGEFREFVIEKFSDDFDIIENVKKIAVGNGTSSKKFCAFVSERLPLEVMITDEKNTTLEARKLYWKLHKPGLLAKLVPQSARVPARVLDDLAAWAIALRALNLTA